MEKELVVKIYCTVTKAQVMELCAEHDVSWEDIYDEACDEDTLRSYIEYEGLQDINVDEEEYIEWCIDNYEEG